MKSSLNDSPSSTIVGKFCHFKAMNFSPTWLLWAIVYFSEVVTTPFSAAESCAMLCHFIAASFESSVTSMLSMLLGAIMQIPGQNLTLAAQDTMVLHLTMLRRWWWRWWWLLLLLLLGLLVLLWSFLLLLYYYDCDVSRQQSERIRPSQASHRLGNSWLPNFQWTTSPL